MAKEGRGGRKSRGREVRVGDGKKGKGRGKCCVIAVGGWTPLSGWDSSWTKSAKP